MVTNCVHSNEMVLQSLSSSFCSIEYWRSPHFNFSTLLDAVIYSLLSLVSHLSPCLSWVPKNWCFWTVVLEKTLESPLDYKEIQPVHYEGDQPWDFFEEMMLKLQLQYFGHLMWRVDSLEKTRILGGIGGRRRRGRQWIRWLDGIIDSKDVSLNESRSWWWTGRPGMLWFMVLQRVRLDWVTELHWTESYSRS